MKWDVYFLTSKNSRSCRRAIYGNNDNAVWLGCKRSTCKRKNLVWGEEMVKMPFLYPAIFWYKLKAERSERGDTKLVARDLSTGRPSPNQKFSILVLHYNPWGILTKCQCAWFTSDQWSRIFSWATGLRTTDINLQMLCTFPGVQCGSTGCPSGLWAQQDRLLPALRQPGIYDLMTSSPPLVKMSIFFFTRLRVLCFSA